MSKKRAKPVYEDDGRTIANMNVEGMPWYRAKGSAPADGGEKSGSSDSAPQELSGEGKRAMTRGVLLASLLVGSIYAVVILLFILFCIFVWFR